MENLGKQLLQDSQRRFIGKDELLEACLETMTDEQLYEMSIKYGFILTERDVGESELDMSSATQEKIIDKVLARHGD
jgi:hypothetical protein